MIAPDICSIIRDEKRNITYRVMAYRELDKTEKMAAVARFLQAAPPSEKIPNSTVTIITLIGASS